MLIPQLLPFALLAGPALARPALLRRQSSDDVIPGITQTSTDLPSIATFTTTATSTTTTSRCYAEYILPNKRNCGQIAAANGVQLPTQDMAYPANSTECERILREYGICPVKTPTTATPSAFPTSWPNATLESIILDLIRPKVVTTTVTVFKTKSMTYTFGTGTTAISKILLVTHSHAEVVSTTSFDSPKRTMEADIDKRQVVGACVTPVPAPAPTAFGANTNCAQWHVAVPGEQCSSVSALYGITVLDFTTLNPAVGVQCTAMLAGHAYCLALCDLSPTNNVVGTNSQAQVQAQIASTFSTSSVVWWTPSPVIAVAQTVAATPTAITASSSFLWWTPSSVAAAFTTVVAAQQKIATSATANKWWTPSPISAVPSSASSSSRLVVSSSSVEVERTISPEFHALAQPTAAPSIVAFAKPVSVAAPTLDVPTLMVPTKSYAPTPTASSNSGGAGANVYTAYYGNGSVAAGWPSMDQWLDFDTLWTANKQAMLTSCAIWNVPNNSEAELAQVKAAIQSVAASSDSIDERFALAIVMQESKGCVRVPTTSWDHNNPGLMQTHQGTGSCNIDGVVQTPCPQSEIVQMIKDGVLGTAAGDGLKQCKAEQEPGEPDDVSGWYRTARKYNGGSIAASGLLEQGCCTLSYASDVANRLAGWVNAPSDFSP